jgi:hypothetical protein
MKNLLSILFLFCLSFTLKAQVVTPVIAGGTVTNTGTGTLTVASVKNSYDYVSLQAIFTKTSGTLGGTATLQWTLDGTNYVTVPTAATVAGAATYTVTDTATQSVIFTIKNDCALGYRVSWTGTGTMVGVLTGAGIVKQ